MRLVPGRTRRRWIPVLRYAHGFQFAGDAMELARDHLGGGANLLVFGAGRDTSTWALVNANGRTVVVEDNPHWAARAATVGGVDVVTVAYETTVAGSRGYTSPGEVPVPSLPPELDGLRFDVVVVDAPAGWGPECPGRAAPMVLAGRLVADDGLVFVDDCFRELERTMRDLVFDRPADAYFGASRPVACYVASPERRARLQAAIRNGTARTGAELIPIDVCDASDYQDAYERIAGPREERGKGVAVRATLRTTTGASSGTPAVQVEVDGMVLGHLGPEQAQRLGPAMDEHFGGRLRAEGAIVDGWRDIPELRDYRLRLWCDRRQPDAPPGELVPQA
ncbi:MAG: hypothetical protein AMXMBFR46_06970 [Acidimicrobiia bacterium]